MNTLAASEKKKAGSVWRRLKFGIPLYTMMIPGFIYLFVNNYMPMAGLIVAFKQYDARKGIFGSDFIGFQNFKYLFATKDALVITRNTLLYNGVFIVLNTVLSIFIAILLSELFSVGARKLYQSVILLPFLISTVIAGYIVYGFLSADSGFINKSILPLLGIDDISWYNEPKYWPVIITLVYIWKNVGYNCIIYLSAIIGIDRQYYEAAALEGAGKVRQIFSITLPMIKSVTIMLILLAIGRIFYADFGLFYQVPMNSGALFPTTNVIDTYVYRSLIQIGNIGMSSAAGFYQSIVGLVLVSVSNLVIRRADPESALF
ncbi:ABC transporter permease [Acutalibacter sp. 1XD8-36]|uniref:ABC transporter permease n=1 Tax=Acutalibacter sp. 1XD8-36 TaxID=2320852 RepID=UPI003FA42487